ncbi:hypothetical protein ACN469_24350 [Corallococcus terminator]
MGQTSDGTVGPLGFAKMILASGSFDRCVVRHLHAQVVGRDIDPTTCALLVGGGIQGNQMLGGYDETMNGAPMGAPVDLIEEGGERVRRAPRSQDIAATVLNAYGLRPGKDFFIPGGFGVFDGVVRT